MMSGSPREPLNLWRSRSILSLQATVPGRGLMAAFLRWSWRLASHDDLYKPKKQT